MKFYKLLLLVAAASAIRINKDDEAPVAGPGKVEGGSEDKVEAGAPKVSYAAKAENLAEGLEAIATQ